MDTDKPKILSPEDVLKEVFRFDEAALDANRNGQLTDRQLGRLISLHKGLFKAMWICIGVIILLTGGMLIESLRSLICWFIIGIALVLAIAVKIWAFWSYIAYDLQDIQLNRVEGIIHLNATQGRNPSYRLEIQDITFNLSLKQFLAFKNLEPYIIYYLPTSHHILSVEWLRDQNIMLEG